MTSRQAVYQTNMTIIQDNLAPELERGATTRDRRLMETSAGFYYGGDRAIESQQRITDGRLIEIAPHDGYRQYMDNARIGSGVLAALDRPVSGANFPAVRAAAGWANVEQAIGFGRLDFDQRLSAIAKAQADFVKARDSLGYIYDNYPEHWLVWPGTYWRYQMSIDALPAALAIADQRDSQSQTFDRHLIGQSQANIRHTLERLVRKYRQAEVEQILDETEHGLGCNHNRHEGRKNVLIGVALEGASLYLTQMAAKDQAVSLPPSIRLDNAGKQGADLSLHRANQQPLTAQVKKYVRKQHASRYAATHLICGIHQMRLPGRQLIDTIEAITHGGRDRELTKMGRRMIGILDSPNQHACPDVRRRQVVDLDRPIAV
ncbi:MAG TPA: hypothetical protein VFL81_00765 [Candidatus Saccharimonadales bacterium]|nr:hypothetical protein [Candidatus Saccharimonadales bacterium]